MNIEKRVTLFGGLPLIARGRLVAPEPDVGFKGGSEDVSLHWLNGREVPEAMYEKMTDDDWDAIHEVLEEEIAR